MQQRSGQYKQKYFFIILKIEVKEKPYFINKQ